MRYLIASTAALLTVLLVACGGDDDATTTTQPPTAANSDAGAAAPAAAAPTLPPVAGSSAGGAAMITIGDETYEFQLQCSFGTGIVQGPGQSQDSTPVYLYGGLPKDDKGQPLDDPEGVDIDVKVGIGQLAGQAVYEYSLRQGNVNDFSDDGHHTEGAANFFYEDGRGAKAGLNYGDLIFGMWDLTCP